MDSSEIRATAAALAYGPVVDDVIEHTAKDRDWFVSTDNSSWVNSYFLWLVKHKLRYRIGVHSIRGPLKDLVEAKTKAFWEARHGA